MNYSYLVVLYTMIFFLIPYPGLFTQAQTLNAVKTGVIDMFLQQLA